MLLDHVAVAVAQPLDEHSRAFDVGEDEGVRPAGSSATGEAYALRATLSSRRPAVPLERPNGKVLEAAVGHARDQETGFT